MAYTPYLIEPIYRSVVRAIVDAIEEINDLGITTFPVEYRNWEERSDEGNLPSKPLLGPDGFSFDENNGLWQIRVALAFSSYLDANLLDEIRVMDYLHQRFGKGKKVALREMNMGEEVNELMIDEFRMLPMGQSELRNYRTIGLELSRTGVNP